MLCLVSDPMSLIERSGKNTFAERPFYLNTQFKCLQLGHEPTQHSTVSQLATKTGRVTYNTLGPFT